MCFLAGDAPPGREGGSCPSRCGGQVVSDRYCRGKWLVSDCCRLCAKRPDGACVVYSSSGAVPDESVCLVLMEDDWMSSWIPSYIWDEEVARRSLIAAWSIRSVTFVWLITQGGIYGRGHINGCLPQWLAT